MVLIGLTELLSLIWTLRPLALGKFLSHLFANVGKKL